MSPFLSVAWRVGNCFNEFRTEQMELLLSEKQLASSGKSVWLCSTFICSTLLTGTSSRRTCSTPA